jgi:hypothetical protein
VMLFRRDDHLRQNEHARRPSAREQLMALSWRNVFAG